MKIAICGSHSTGKSTLLQDLVETGQLKNTPAIQEIARCMIQEGWEMGTEGFQREVIKRQISAENSLNSFVSDRSVLDNLAYSKAISEDLYRELEVLSRGQTYDKVIFLPIEFGIENDGVRFIAPEFQKEIQNHILQILADTATNFQVITGSREERVVKVLEYINI